MEQLASGLNVIAGFFMETVGGLLGGAIFLPALIALPIGLLVLIVMILRELRR